VSKWRRGDFHTHTAHSDGSCGQEGERGPCPTLSTLIAARDAGLDFVAVTDHNTITQLADIRMMQALSSAPLLIPGTEISGEVVACGPGVIDLAPGDRVCASLRRGGFAELAAVPRRTVYRLPDGIVHDAATLFPTLSGTAYAALRWRAMSTMIERMTCEP
jgi:NADPH:quinone reductase-like Zn-dependent oxidoreductase